MAKRNDKRNRLVTAAEELFQEKGVNVTTLANIAQLADVPLGNVYYYFKSKESIVLAVIEFKRRSIQNTFEELDLIPNSKERLQSLIEKTAVNSDRTASFGDALGGLCQELGKQGGNIAQAASDLLNEILQWCEKQFINLGKVESAKQLAIHLISSLQGISLLTLAFKDPNYLNKQSEYLLGWLDNL